MGAAVDGVGLKGGCFLECENLRGREEDRFGGGRKEEGVEARVRQVVPFEDLKQWESFSRNGLLEFCDEP